jgi:hypothetical protein
MHSWHPLLASDFGNLLFLITCVPTIALALVVGAIAAFFRARWLCVLCGSVMLVAAAVLALSYGAARSEDKQRTLRIAEVGGLLGGLLLLVPARPTKR